MKQAKLHGMTIDQLVEHFAAVALAQDQALLMNEYGRFNKLYGEMNEIKEELKSREGDQRTALLPLYKHQNAQVRLKAAVATLAVAPRAARQALETIANSKEYPQAGDAGMSLLNLDRGIFRPT
jgi:hypothetical protein